MKSNLRLRAERVRRLILPVLVGFFCCFSAVNVQAMGMDFGGGDSGEDATCTPDDPLVIVPGPLGSPLRMVPFADATFLVADYGRRSVFRYEQSGSLTHFLETMGRPLSIAVDAVFNAAGKLKEATYFVGNDDDRTIDVYYEKNQKLVLVGQYPVTTMGVQALDLAFDQDRDELYVVDGVAREVKVLRFAGSPGRNLRAGRAGSGPPAPEMLLLRNFGGDGVLINPKGVAVDAGTGEVFVSDYGDSAVGIPAAVKVFDGAGNRVSALEGRFSRPQGLLLLNGKVYLADNMRAQVLEFDRATAAMTATYGCRGSSEGHLLLPMDVTIDAAAKNLHVVDNRNRRITVLPLTQP